MALSRHGGPGHGTPHGTAPDHHPHSVAGSPYSTLRSTRAGAPAAIENGPMSLVTTLLAPITQRSPMLTPLVTTTLTPSQQLSPILVGPLALEALPGDWLLGIVVAVACIRDEAAVGKHAVISDLDKLLGGDHHAHVQERAAADAHAGAAGHRDPYAGLQQRVRTDLQASLAQRR